MGGWYKQYYLMTAKDMAQIKAAISDPIDGAQNRADIQKRISELNQIPEDRCHISRDQKRFLEKVLNDQ